MASLEDIPSLMAAAHQMLEQAEAESDGARLWSSPIVRDNRPFRPGNVMFAMAWELDASARQEQAFTR